MADIYQSDPNAYYQIGGGESKAVPKFTGNRELDQQLAGMTDEQRQRYIQEANAPLTGADVAELVQKANAGQVQYEPTAEEVQLYKEWAAKQNHDILSEIAQGFGHIKNTFFDAAGEFYKHPVDSTIKMPATVAEGFFQGGRNLYGMVAQSQDPNSALFKFKSILTGDGSDPEAERRQFIEAMKFNRHSMEIEEGKATVLMNKDLIDPKIAIAASYIADPTLLIPYVGEATGISKAVAAGSRAIGIGERMAKIAARAEMIQNQVIGGTLKWGVGTPIEFMGGAVRNTLDYGMAQGGRLAEAATGMPMSDWRATARLTGMGAAAGEAVGLGSVPVMGTIGKAQLGSTFAVGAGGAIGIVGDQMLKQAQFGRGILSYAGQALRDAERAGIELAPHTKNLLKAIDFVDPLFSYGNTMVKGAAHGAFVGGVLGGLSGGVGGMAQGIGAGIGLGIVGGTAGKVMSDVSGATFDARTDIQSKMVMEGWKQTNKGNYESWDAIKKFAQMRVEAGLEHPDIINKINGYIAGMDTVAPNAKMNAFTPEQYLEFLKKNGFNPETAMFAENHIAFEQFGLGREEKAKALSVLRDNGMKFAGDPEAFKQEMANTKNLKYKKTWDGLSENAQNAVLDAIKGHKELISKLKGEGDTVKEYYADRASAEAFTDNINQLHTQSPTLAAKKIADVLEGHKDENGKLTRRGEILKDKLRAEGYLDRDGTILAQRGLVRADATASDFKLSKGFAIQRASDGTTQIYLNLKEMGKETFPHELFHAIMREHPMQDSWIKRLKTDLIGLTDDKGNIVQKAAVNPEQLKDFFDRYLKIDPQNPRGETMRAEMDAAMKEFQQTGDNKKVSPQTVQTLNRLVEEFGAYYFSEWLQGKPSDFLFMGGDYTGMRGIFENTKEGWLNFWREKMGNANPDYNFNTGALHTAFAPDGERVRNQAMDLFMKDYLRATANSVRGRFDPTKLSEGALRTFTESNGIYTVAERRNGRTRSISPIEYDKNTISAGREIFKVLEGLDKSLRTSQTYEIDGKRFIKGRLSEAELDAIVKSGHRNRAWADKHLQLYGVLDGKGSNVIEFGYLGKTAQIGDYSWPRLTGKDVPFKNRTAILIGMETHIGENGQFHTLFHTLDKQVIDSRANDIWKNPEVRELWKNNRGAMEDDFFRYLENASKQGDRVDSATLLDNMDGLGSKRRDWLHQMAGMEKGASDVYLNKPIVEIPAGIRKSVTTFNMDGATHFRQQTGARFPVNDQAIRDISRNFQPAEMDVEQTANGKILKSKNGFKISVDKSGNATAYSPNGAKIGTYPTVKEASEKAKALLISNAAKIEPMLEQFNKEQVAKQVRFQPIDTATREQATTGGISLFDTDEIKQFTLGSRVVKQTQQEYVTQRILDMIKPENRDTLNSIVEQEWSKFAEMYAIEKTLNQSHLELSFDINENKKVMKSLTDEIANIISHRASNDVSEFDKKLLDSFGNTYKRQLELIDRMNQLIDQMDASGIKNKSSRYWSTKVAYEAYKSGDIKPETAEQFLKNVYQSDYNSNFKTGEAVSFVSVHGTPNKALMESKMYDSGRLGLNTGSASAKRATFSAGSDTTAVNYIGHPLEKGWADTEDYSYYINKHERNSFTPEGYQIVDSIKKRIETLDTTRSVVNELKLIQENLLKDYPEYFEEFNFGNHKAVHGKNRTGSEIKNYVDSLYSHMRDADSTFGGYAYSWKEANRPMNILRQITRMDNPFVFEYKSSDFRDEKFVDIIKRAEEAGHDGVIFKNVKDGGGDDIIYALLHDNPNSRIKVFDSAWDENACNRGVDENGNKIMNGRELNLYFQPNDNDIYSGGRKYDQNSKLWKSGFIGLYAAQNPERIKGYNLQFFQKEKGAWRVRLTDNSRKGESADVGHITAVVSGDTATLSSHINKEYRGNKLAFVVYSEMAERLRAMGIQKVDGQIVNPEGVPVHVREQIIGDTRDYFSGKPISQQEAATRIQAKQKEFGSMAGVDVSNRLYEQGRYQPADDRNVAFNRIYREASRAPKRAARELTAEYLDNWGINISDFERFQQLTDAHYKLQQEFSDGKYQVNDWQTRQDKAEELQELKNEIKELTEQFNDNITSKQGDYAHQFTDQLDQIEYGVKTINNIIKDIQNVSLSDVDSWAGTNRLNALYGKRLGRGFANEITGDNIPIKQAIENWAARKYERTMGDAFESELYSSTDLKPRYVSNSNGSLVVDRYDASGRKGILVDILKSENKINEYGVATGEIMPQRVINALRNKSGGNSKAYAEAKAIGLIDWLESKQEGRNQKKVRTNDLLNFVDENQMGLAIDPQLEQNADFGNTRPHVTGGDTQAEKGYRVYVVRMANSKHEHGVKGHFEGAVVHVRATLRNTKDGRKVMHIEEIQANNTATDVLSESQRKIVTEEVNVLNKLKREYDEAFLRSQTEHNTLRYRYGDYTNKDFVIAEEARKVRWQETLKKISDKYAETLFDLNPEYWKEKYESIGNKSRDGYISVLSKSLSNSDYGMMISERQTRLSAKKNNAPLQDPKEWVKVAFRTVLRKALVEGVDRITVTPWDETPIQVGMKSKSAERFYGKTIADAFNSELSRMNSVLSVEGKHESIPRQIYSKSKVATNDAIQKVATEFDYKDAQARGADVGTIFKLLHADDADLALNHKISALQTRFDFLLKGVPKDVAGEYQLRYAMQRRLNQFRDYLVLNESQEGGTHPSGLEKKASAAGMSNSEYLVDRSMGFDINKEMRQAASKPQRLMQPAEGWRDWKSESTNLGFIIKNSVGWVIMQNGNKFKVYNPYKAVAGIYSSQDEAKRRVQREEPKR